MQRWRKVTRGADLRTSQRMDKKTSTPIFRHSIVFGAGKRCTPNLFHTVACYAVPESPLPKDLYGANTDTIVGVNRWSSLRQRYLNAGVAVGTVGDMRRIFSHASDKLSQIKEHEEFDNGSHESDFIYRGSDQSVWNTIFGEQEFQREGMRREGKPYSSVEPSWMEGTKIDDPIEPYFTHQSMEKATPGRHEFGIALDYWSEVTQQTINTEQDTRFLHYSRPLTEQLEPSSPFDCKPRSRQLPADLQSGLPPYYSSGNANATWADVPLFSNICLDSVPVIVHHNGIKAARETMWHKFWVSDLLKSLRKSDFFHNRVIAVAGQSELQMLDLCPATTDGEIFGGA